MHDIEPYFKWRDEYIASEDKDSLYFGKQYDEFKFSNKIYNYFIHPQWDEFGSKTLYLKILFVEYSQSFAIIEMIGEWNDCLYNDVMYLKRDVVDHLQKQGINKFILLCGNVLNFHASDESYYEEWFDDVSETGGWVCFVNLLDHVSQEMRSTLIHHYINMGGDMNDIEWHQLKPHMLFQLCESLIIKRVEGV